MNPYVEEEVMWQRLIDVQREAENRRLVAPRGSLIGLLSSLMLGLGRALTAGQSTRLVRAEPWLDSDTDEADRVA